MIITLITLVWILGTVVYFVYHSYGPIRGVLCALVAIAVVSLYLNHAPTQRVLRAVDKARELPVNIMKGVY
jgi:hypothetical protein